MRPLRALLGSTPLLDEDTADRLLGGRLDPADAPSGYAPVARVTRAATGPVTPEELAGEAAAIATFRAVAHASPPITVPRRAPMPSRLFSVKAAAVVVAVLSVGGVAAAAGKLPGRSQQAAQHASTTSQAGSSERAHSGGATGAHGPDATGPAKDGLCQAWRSGQGSTNGSRMEATAFEALAKAAGGADKVAAYCQAALAAKGAGHAGAGPDAGAATKDGLCKAWRARQAAGHGGSEQSPAFDALVKAAGGADNVAAYCQPTPTTAGSGHSQAPDQQPNGGSSSSNGHGGGQGAPATTGPPSGG
jgi:hypothetical protein